MSQSAFSQSTVSVPVSVANGGTGAATLTGILLGNGTGAITPITTSAGIAGALSDGTGSGSLVFATSPTFITPTLGVASATSVSVVDSAYSSAWDGSTLVPTRNAVYDANFYDDDLERTLTGLGSTILFIGGKVGWPAATASTGISLANNVARYMVVYINRNITITGVKWFQISQGSYTANNNNYVALYSYSGGTMTQVAISANNASLWTVAATTMGSAPFTSPYAATPGVYFIGILYNESAQTTAPSIAFGTGTNQFISESLDFTNSAKFSGTVATQNTLPSTQAMSGVSSSVSVPWLALY